MIGLVQNYKSKHPNYALMKIYSYYRRKGIAVEWVRAGVFYDKIYVSKIFTYMRDVSLGITALGSGEIIRGGTGYEVNSKLPDKIEKSSPDYSLYGLEHGYGFLTRGCIRKCDHCLVPEKEGVLRPYNTIEEILQDRKEAILLDNNVLASDFGIKQIEKSIDLKVKIDINQGLDARLIDGEMAKLLSEVKWRAPLRMACDSVNMKYYLERAVKELRKYHTTPSNYFIYVLVKDLEEALDIVEFLRELKCDPFAQPFIDFKNKKMPSREQRRFARWVNIKKVWKSMTWEEYKKWRGKRI